MKGDSHAYPFLLTAGLVLGATLIPSAATAQQARTCAPRDNVLSHLAQKYGETPIAIGVTTWGGLVEVLANPKSDTWTFILSSPDGTSCLVAAGEGWRAVVPVETGPAA